MTLKDSWIALQRLGKNLMNMVFLVVNLVHSKDFNNEALLQYLESEKVPYLFSSKQLIQILSLTSSVKTRLAIIDHIAPRLTDPRVEYDNLVGLFRYSEEKSHVEDALKSRIQTMNHAIFKKESSAVFNRGGRGRGLSSGKSMFLGGRLGGHRPTSLPVPLRADDIGAQSISLDDEADLDSPTSQLKSVEDPEDGPIVQHRHIMFGDGTSTDQLNDPSESTEASPEETPCDEVA